MKKLNLYLCLLTVSLLSANTGYAQDFIKTDIGFTFLGGKSFIQSFDFNLNRTEEAQNKSGGRYFLYSASNFYIIPTVDANIGQSVTGANNNIVTQVSFGKRFTDILRKTSPLNEWYYKFGVEMSPTCNADKTFAEKLYYTQLKVYLNPVFTSYDPDLSKHFFRSEFSISFNPLLNMGNHDSQTYKTDAFYSAAGFNSALMLTLNKQDDKKKVYGDWVFKLTGNEYRLFSEIRRLYAKDYYGQAGASIDKSVRPDKISVNVTYNYGNDNPKYTTMNALTLGFKYKY